MNDEYLKKHLSFIYSTILNIDAEDVLVILLNGFTRIYESFYLYKN